MLSIAINEQQFLRCLIEKPELIAEVEENYCVTQIAIDLFQVLYNLFNREESIKPTVSHIVSEGNKINSAITPDLVNDLMEVSFEIDSFSYYVKRIKEDFAKNDITERLLQDTLEETIKKGDLDIDKLQRLADQIEHHIQTIKGDRHLLKTSDDMIEEYSEVFDKRLVGEWSFPTGDSYLDQYLAFGFLPGQMSILFAATGMGKSMFALNLVNKQINKGIPSLYLSLEMDLIATFDRLLCIRASIPMEYLWPSNIEEHAEDVEPMLQTQKEMLTKQRRFLFSEQSNISISDLRYIVREAKRRMDTDYLIMTVDLMTMLSDFSQGDNTPAYQYEANMNRLHELVKSEGVHMMGVVQANRNADSAKITDWDHLDRLKPSFNHIKNSHAIGERSRIVMSAFRKMFYAQRFFPEDERIQSEPDIMEIDILKQNMGPLAHLDYLFDNRTGRIGRYVHRPIPMGATEDD